MTPRCQLKLLLTLVILVICVYQANAATFTFYDGFEDGVWNDTWSFGIPNESCQGTVIVLEARPHSGTKSLYIAENLVNNAVGVYRSFTFNITNVGVWFWWRDLSDDNSGLRIQILDQNSRFMGGVGFLDQYVTSYGVWFQGKELALIGNWEPETWNHIEINLNLNSGTASVYLNGNLLASDLELADTGGYPCYLSIWTDDSEVYVDDIVVEGFRTPPQVPIPEFPTIGLVLVAVCLLLYVGRQLT